MNRSKFGVSVSFALLATVVIPSYVPQAQSREIGETPDFALRRAQAFHDMYAAPPDKATLAARVERAASQTIGGRRARALPINYGSFDPEFRLKPLLRQGQLRADQERGEAAEREENEGRDHI